MSDVRSNLDETILDLKKNIEENTEVGSDEQTAALKSYKELISVALEDDRRAIELETNKVANTKDDRKFWVQTGMAGLLLIYDALRTRSLLKFEETGAIRSNGWRMSLDTLSMLKSKIWH